MGPGRHDAAAAEVCSAVHANGLLRESPFTKGGPVAAPRSREPGTRDAAVRSRPLQRRGAFVLLATFILSSCLAAGPLTLTPRALSWADLRQTASAAFVVHQAVSATVIHLLGRSQGREVPLFVPIAGQLAGGLVSLLLLPLDFLVPGLGFVLAAVASSGLAVRIYDVYDRLGPPAQPLAASRPVSSPVVPAPVAPLVRLAF